MVKKRVNWVGVISPEAIANSRWCTRPLPETLPSIGTLYGGSVKTTLANARFISVS